MCFVRSVLCLCRHMEPTDLHDGDPRVKGIFCATRSGLVSKEDRFTLAGEHNGCTPTPGFTDPTGVQASSGFALKGVCRKGRRSVFGLTGSGVLENDRRLVDMPVVSWEESNAVLFGCCEKPLMLQCVSHRAGTSSLFRCLICNS